MITFTQIYSQKLSLACYKKVAVALAYALKACRVVEV